MRVVTLAAGVAAIALAGEASAQSSGFYVAADAGYHGPETIEATSYALPSAGWDFETESNWAILGRAGYRFDNGDSGLRFEIEAGYRPTAIEAIDTLNPSSSPTAVCPVGSAAPSCGDLGGSIDITTTMLNAVYDILPDAPVQPFIGGGLGLAFADMDLSGRLAGVPTNQAQSQVIQFSDKDRAFAWQVIGGASIRINERMTVDVTGRYLMSNEYDLGSRTTATGGTGTVSNLGEFHGRYKDASLTVGLRYALGAKGS